jgi:hypothetical protein
MVQRYSGSVCLTGFAAHSDEMFSHKRGDDHRMLRSGVMPLISIVTAANRVSINAPPRVVCSGSVEWPH